MVLCPCIRILSPSSWQVPPGKEPEEELRDRADFPGIHEEISQSLSEPALRTSTEQSGNMSPWKGFFALLLVVEANTEFLRLELTFIQEDAQM